MYLQCFRDVGPSYIVTKPTPYCWTFANSTLGFRRAFCENSNLDGGKLVSGMMTTMFHGHPEQYTHTRARTHHTLLQKQILLRRGLGLRGVGEPLHVQLAFGFLCLKRCCGSGFRSVKTFLAPEPAFCTVFTAFSYYATTCDSAVSSPSGSKKKCGRCGLPKNSLSPPNMNFSPTLPHFHQTKKRMRSRRGPKTPDLTPKSYFRGPELVPEKAFSKTTQQSIQVRNPMA